MKLYGHIVSPYVARVAFAARLKGLSLTPEPAPGGGIALDPAQAVGVRLRLAPALGLSVGRSAHLERIDHIGIAKVHDIQVSNDQVLVRLEDGTPPVMMDTKKIRPLSTIEEYELLRLLNQIGNKRKMVAIGLESPKPKVDSKKRAKRVVPASIPATNRVLRRRPTIAQGEESTPECHLLLTDGL